MEENVCDFCGEEKSVELRPNPYADEIYGDSTLHYICDECYNELSSDI